MVNWVSWKTMITNNKFFEKKEIPLLFSLLLFLLIAYTRIDLGASHSRGLMGFNICRCNIIS